MTITYGFFDSVDGDRKYSAEDIGRYLHGIVSSGVYADASDSLQILAYEGMKCTLQPGRAMLDYHYMENDSPLYFGLTNGDAQDRIDAIVLRLDKSGRLCQFAVKKGSPAAKPTAPTVTRTETVKEYMLATVYVRKLATAITQDDITDTRANNEVCGFVHGIIDQVDTSTLFAQYEAAYANKLAALDEYVAAQQAALDEYVAQKEAEVDSRLASIDNTINNANVAGVPIPTASNAGMVPTVNSDGTAYELEEIVQSVQVITRPFETDGYYVDVNKFSAGLYLFKAPLTLSAPTLKIRLQDSDGSYVVVGQPGPYLFCLIETTGIYNMGKKIGQAYTLRDFANGKTYHNEYRDANAAWTYTEISNFVETVNGTGPDADGDVKV